MRRTLFSVRLGRSTSTKTCASACSRGSSGSSRPRPRPRALPSRRRSRRSTVIPWSSTIPRRASVSWTRSAGTFPPIASAKPDLRRQARISERSARNGTRLLCSGLSAAPTPTAMRRPRRRPAQRDPDQSQSALCPSYPSDLADRRRGVARRGARLAGAIEAASRLIRVSRYRAADRLVWAGRAGMETLLVGA